MFWMKNMDAVQSETVPWCFTWTCIISPIFFLAKMCQDGCGIALSLQILVHGKTPEPHLFLLAAPGSTGCFASCSTQTPAPALFPYCCHSITSCSPGPTLLSLQSSWLKIVSAVFRHIAFKGGDGVSDKLSNALKKQRNYFHAPPKWDLTMKWHHLHPCLACDPLFCILFFAQSILMWYLCISILLKCTVLQLSLNVALLDYWSGTWFVKIVLLW